MFKSMVVSLLRRNKSTDELLLLLENPFQASVGVPFPRDYLPLPRPTPF
jgi:hypothetical protein